MSTATGNSIMARARTLSTQMGGDANQSAVIDSLGGARALLNHSIREVYRRKSNDQKFIQDIVVKQTITIASGEGACPDEVMREFLHAAQFADVNNSLISYYKYAVDAESGQGFDQLGIAWLVGDTMHYRAPSPDFGDYSGDLYVTVPSFPTFPASMSDTISFPSDATIDDVVLFLASALIGKEAYQVVSV